MALKVSFKDSLCFVEIDNSQAGNSFGPQESKELTQLLKSKKLNDCQGLLWLTPQGGIFCSGGNLKHYKNQKQRSDGIKTNREIAKSLLALSRLSIPTVALVDGDCFGGGLELLSTFDFVISTPKPFFGFWQRRIGLTFGWGGGSRLNMRLGTKVLTQQALLANSFSAYRAAEMGLVDEIVPHHQLHHRAIVLIENLNSRSKLAFEPNKTWEPAREKTIFEKLWFNPDHKKILRHFN